MKILSLLVAVALVTGCASTPAEKEARRQRVLKERAEWREANRQYFMEDYAHRLGRAVSELTPAQRAEAEMIFKRDHHE